MAGKGTALEHGYLLFLLYVRNNVTIFCRCWRFFALPSAAFSATEANTTRRENIHLFSYPTANGPTETSAFRGVSAGQARFSDRRSVPAFHVEAEIKAEAAKLVEAARDYKPDFLVLCDDEGADVLAPEMKRLGIPLLFAGINKDEKDVAWLEKGAELTGVFERYPVEPSLKLLTNLTTGRVKNISLLTSVNPTSVIIEKQLSGYFKTHKTRIALKQVYMTNKWEEWKAAIQAANKESDSLWMLVPWNVEDAAGQRLDLRVMGKCPGIYRAFP